MVTFAGEKAAGLGSATFGGSDGLVRLPLRGAGRHDPAGALEEGASPPSARVRRSGSGLRCVKSVTLRPSCTTTMPKAGSQRGERPRQTVGDAAVEMRYPAAKTPSSRSVGIGQLDELRREALD